jgi:NAD(P)H dehydrogenase (quinone)
MQDVNVVVVFYSRTGSTERLALAAAVGAVQGLANIRLRRLSDPGDVTITQEDRERMNREYVAPREADAAWADAIILGMPADVDTLSAEFEQYFDSLCVLRDQGKFEGKIGSSFTQGVGTGPLYAAMCAAGFITVPVMQNPDQLVAARLQGRRIADMARSLRVS